MTVLCLLYSVTYLNHTNYNILSCDYRIVRNYKILKTNQSKQEYIILLHQIY